MNAEQVWHLDLCVTLGVYLAPQLSYECGDDGDGGDVPGLVHLVAQLVSELDPKCDT